VAHSVAVEVVLMLVLVVVVQHSVSITGDIGGERVVCVMVYCGGRRVVVLFVVVRGVVVVREARVAE